MALQQFTLTLGENDAVELSVGSYDLWKFEKTNGRSVTESLDDMYRLIHLAALRKNIAIPGDFDAFMALAPEFEAIDEDAGKVSSST